MKLNSFKFQDGKVFWLPEYPEKPDYETWVEGDPDTYSTVLNNNTLLRDKSAIEVAQEAVGRVKNNIFMQNPEVRGGLSTSRIWQPEKDKVYSAECEMERVEQWALKGTHEWYDDDDERFDLHHPDDTDYRQVASLKP